MSATRLIHQEDINRYISSRDKDENVDSTSESEMVIFQFPAAIAKGVKNSFLVCHICPSVATSTNKCTRKKPPYWCENCDVALCVDPCFAKYHTRLT